MFFFDYLVYVSIGRVNWFIWVGPSPTSVAYRELIILEHFTHFNQKDNICLSALGNAFSRIQNLFICTRNTLLWLFEKLDNCYKLLVPKVYIVFHYPLSTVITSDGADPFMTVSAFKVCLLFCILCLLRSIQNCVCLSQHVDYLHVVHSKGLLTEIERRTR